MADEQWLPSGSDLAERLGDGDEPREADPDCCPECDDALNVYGVCPGCED